MAFQNSLVARPSFMNAKADIGVETMSKADVFNRTLLCVGITTLSALISAFLSDSGILPPATLGIVTIISVVLTIAAGIYNAFKMTAPRPWVILTYCAAEGFLLGVISIAYNTLYDGVVLQAVLATAAVVWACSLGSKYLATSTKSVISRFIMIALPAYCIFALINAVLVWFHVLPGFGVYSMGPLGILISLGAILLGSFMLVRDFDNIDEMVGVAPREFSWSISYSILLDIVWLYIEILRLLAILNEKK
ncbi:MAG: Bax inhibitor-1/YccA family protein [Candidatus Ancillula sp.]|jgi:uncharacterized YccA/Bax inhibitor family protein|nr:Bax inhibitor-1/YccA family protein [Candidatus Ancillula sp.]